MYLKQIKEDRFGPQYYYMDELVYYYLNIEMIHLNNAGNAE